MVYHISLRVIPSGDESKPNRRNRRKGKRSAALMKLSAHIKLENKNLQTTTSSITSFKSPGRSNDNKPEEESPVYGHELISAVLRHTAENKAAHAGSLRDHEVPQPLSAAMKDVDRMWTGR
ncbi:hypothetical protein LSAT2_016585 [Lamellibrachia satsuma]|nr:hypothetical protein LSAT2_016585 [Lamellibrachia satsuma]